MTVSAADADLRRHETRSILLRLGLFIVCRREALFGQLFGRMTQGGLLQHLHHRLSPVRRCDEQALKQLVALLR